MAPVSVFQRALDRDASLIGESNHQPHEASPAETLLTRNRSVHSQLAKSDLPNSPCQVNDDRTITNVASRGTNYKPGAADSKDREIVRLQRLLTDLKTADRANEALLRSTRIELKNARDTLNTTFSEYCDLRDEMKMIKQKITKEHQAVIYRKDIELFALRKGNEQKEKYIKEHDAKLDEVYHQQRATVELKDAQLKMLKQRLAMLDRQRSPRFAHEQEGPEQGEEADQAVQVRVLRIQKGRASLEDDQSRPDEEKDTTIAILREQLAVAKKAAEEVVNQRAELQRAWDIVKQSQASLTAERELHRQAKEQLQELSGKSEEGSEQQRSRANSVSRLPTIEEDKEELEAIFDTVQQDNTRLYAGIEALDKRLRDANARMFAAESEAEKLRAQVQKEKSTGGDFEHARTSVADRERFQHMEAQLKDNRDTLALKEREVALLKKALSEKIDVMANLHNELDAAISFHTQDQDEIERLATIIDELERTKDQLRRDHERLAAQRTHRRASPAERNHASARSSGTTLIQETSPPLTRPSDETDPIEALPPIHVPSTNERVGQTQQPHRTHERCGSSPTLIVNDVPPAELRSQKRRSWGVRAYVKKIVNKDPKATDETYEQGLEPAPRPKEESTRGTAALSLRDKNAMLRPNTAAPVELSASPTAFMTPAIARVPVPQNVRSTSESRHPLRYYATPLQEQEAHTKGEERPNTAASEAKSKDKLARSLKRRTWGAYGTKAKEEERPNTAAAKPESKDDSMRSLKRRSYDARNKLKRRSMN